MKGTPKTIIFLVLILSTSTLSAPSGEKDFLDITEEKIKGGLEKLKAAPNVTKEVIEEITGVFDDLYDFVGKATDNIKSLRADFKALDDANQEIKTEFLDEFNEIKVELGATRQELRKLAVATVSSSRRLRNYVNEIETNPDIKLFKKVVDIMKKLLVKTGDQLAKAQVSYKKAIKTMVGFERKLRGLMEDLRKRGDVNSEEYQAFASDVRAASYSSCGALTAGMIVADIFGCFGICSATATTTCWSVSIPAVEGVLSLYRDTLDNIANGIERVKTSVVGLEEFGNAAVGILENELSIVLEWEESADTLEDQITEYPAESLIEFVSDRKNFMILVDDLQKVAQDFINQPVSFFVNIN